MKKISYTMQHGDMWLNFNEFSSNFRACLKWKFCVDIVIVTKRVCYESIKFHAQWCRFKKKINMREKLRWDRRRHLIVFIPHKRQAWSLTIWCVNDPRKKTIFFYHYMLIYWARMKERAGEKTHSSGNLSSSHCALIRKSCGLMKF